MAIVVLLFSCQTRHVSTSHARYQIAKPLLNGELRPVRCDTVEPLRASDMPRVFDSTPEFGMRNGFEFSTSDSTFRVGHQLSNIP